MFVATIHEFQQTLHSCCSKEQTSGLWCRNVFVISLLRDDLLQFYGFYHRRDIIHSGLRCCGWEKKFLFGVKSQRRGMVRKETCKPAELQVKFCHCAKVPKIQPLSRVEATIQSTLYCIQVLLLKPPGSLLFLPKGTLLPLLSSGGTPPPLQGFWLPLQLIILSQLPISIPGTVGKRFQEHWLRNNWWMNVEQQQYLNI